MLTIEERIADVFDNHLGMTYVHGLADFVRRLRKRGPTRLAIETLVNIFQRTGSTADVERPGRQTITSGTLQRAQDANTLKSSASGSRLSLFDALRHFSLVVYQV